MSAKKRNVLLFVSASAMLVVLANFQNCSNVKFAGDQSVSSLSTDGPLAVEEAEVRVSAQQVPPLKLVFVVDNSYTMKVNRIALSQSFEAMFKGASSLAKFDVTSYLISTAQRAPAWASDDLNAIAKLQVDPNSVNASQLNLFRTAAQNTGALPGDNLGFGLSLSADGTQASFRPAPVLGAGSAPSSVDGGIHKAAGADYAGLSAAFQNRLALLDSDRIPRDAHQAQQFGSIIDAESGMCAMARILRDNDQFFKSNEQAAFVLVSDEDENDPAGANCVRGYQNVTQPDVLIKGTCEERSTIISYNTAVQNAATCVTSFDAGYNFKYTYPTTTPAYDITYKRQKTAASYVSPRTQVTYAYKRTSYYTIETAVDYYTCGDVISDKSVVQGLCDPKLVKGFKLAGDQKATCNAAIKAKDPKAMVDGGAPAMPVCTVNTPATNAVCANGDPNCGSTVDYPPESKWKDGVVTQADCAGVARGFNSNFEPSKTYSCVSNDSTALKGSGACPSNLVAVGCVSTPATYEDYTAKQVAGDFAGAKCQNAKFGDQQPNTTASNCAPNDIKGTGSKTGQIAFSNVDGGQLVAKNGADCGAVQAQAVANAQAQGAPAGGQCVITSYYQGAKGNGSTDSAAACAADAKSVTDTSQMTKRNPGSQYTAASTGSTKKQLDPVPRDIKCDDLCADSNNVACKGNQDPNIKIADFLKQAPYLATSCDVVTTVTSSTAFADRKLADKDQICVGSADKPKYIKYDPTASYHKVALITDYVAGTGGAGPQSDLTTYINQRSGELFGKLKPLVSVFVRTPADGAGENGSVGTAYDTMAKTMGGLSDSVMNSSYGAGLAKLSGIIQDRLQRTFVISQMKPYQAVHAVQIRRGGAGEYQPLDPAQWNAAGNSVTIDPTVSLNLDDQLRFQYY